MIRNEFFQQTHFLNNYKRHTPKDEASLFIEQIWESAFHKPENNDVNGLLFYDRVLPSVGSTILVNLGTPFSLQVAGKRFEIQGDICYSRHQPIMSAHYSGNEMIGIRMRSNFISENLRGKDPIRCTAVLPKEIIDKIRRTEDFTERCTIITSFIMDAVGERDHVRYVTKNINEAVSTFSAMIKEKLSVASVAKEVHSSSKTLERAFLKYVWDTPKKCFRIIRFRNAIEQYNTNPEEFCITDFGYFDHSHFYREIKEFTGTNLGDLKSGLK